jgi:L-alanine-DL-glutamate epimerase-like enolase superfamily enzyme
MASRRLTVTRESWPIAGTFTIARGSKTQAEIVLITLEQVGIIGRGECVPYRRYGETIDGVISEIETQRTALEQGIDRHGLINLMPAGAARNAIDAALIDLSSKQQSLRAWDLIGIDPPKPAPTCFTISLDSPQAMAEAAEKAAGRPILKVKLGAGTGDLDRILAVRQAAPRARLVIDANEGWTFDLLVQMAPGLARLNVELIEQPLPAGQDDALTLYKGPVPICADESAQGSASLDDLAQRYQAINIKLDKTGGLTHALEFTRAAKSRGLQIMLGCMVGTSLGMAPASLLMDFADFVDLDGPLLLARDREPGLNYDHNLVHLPDAALWG